MKEITEDSYSHPWTQPPHFEEKMIELYFLLSVKNHLYRISMNEKEVRK